MHAYRARVALAFTRGADIGLEITEAQKAMDDVVFEAKINDETHLYISPIARQTFEDHFPEGGLGGDRGYFVLQTRKCNSWELEILAKAPSLEAANDLFDLIMMIVRDRTNPTSGIERSEDGHPS